MTSPASSPPLLGFLLQVFGETMRIYFGNALVQRPLVFNSLEDLSGEDQRALPEPLIEIVRMLVPVGSEFRTRVPNILLFTSTVPELQVESIVGQACLNCGIVGRRVMTEGALQAQIRLLEQRAQMGQARRPRRDGD